MLRVKVDKRVSINVARKLVNDAPGTSPVRFSGKVAGDPSTHVDSVQFAISEECKPALIDKAVSDKETSDMIWNLVKGVFSAFYSSSAGDGCKVSLISRLVCKHSLDIGSRMHRVFESGGAVLLSS